MKILLRAALAVALIGAGLTGYWAWLGYFGGDTFVPVAATAAPAPGFADLTAVIVSGDMGFRTGMGPKLAERLAAEGVPVVGVNSLVYFRQRRSPAEIETLIADAVRRSLAADPARRVVLIGQSYGADMVQVGAVGLSPALRAKVAMVALIVPSDTVNYLASPTEMLGFVPSDAAALPTGAQLNWVPTLCVSGQDEDDSLCPQLTAGNVRKVQLPGGHPLHRDVDSVYATLRGFIVAHAPGKEVRAS